MNLVFEWCASRKGERDDPAAGQRLMLAEIHRILKPGGRLYLLTKNRYAMRLLLGKRDEHCDKMRWGNALPRWLMRLAMRMKGKAQPRGLLHSYNALRGMLRSAGFVETRSYWAVPEMRHPKACVPTDAASVRAARRQPGFVQGEFRSTRALMPLCERVAARLKRKDLAGRTVVLKLKTRQFRLLLLAKEHLETGGYPKEIASAIGVHPYVAEKLAKQTRSFTLQNLETIYRALQDYDFKMKTGQIKPRLALDLLIAGLTR